MNRFEKLLHGVLDRTDTFLHVVRRMNCLFPSGSIIQTNSGGYR